MPDYDALLAGVSELPLAERIQLIEALWDTVPDNALPPLSKEWLAEIQRRSAEFDSGTVRTVPWEEIQADALRRAGVTEPNVPPLISSQKRVSTSTSRLTGTQNEPSWQLRVLQTLSTRRYLRSQPNQIGLD